MSKGFDTICLKIISQSDDVMRVKFVPCENVALQAPQRLMPRSAAQPKVRDNRKMQGYDTRRDDPNVKWY